MPDAEIMRFCRAYARMCPSLPIRRSQMAVLSVLCSSPGPHTPAAVAEVMGVSRPMVTTHMSVLCDAGYVVRMASPDDGRSVYMLPTKSGKKLYTDYVNANNRIMSELSNKMGAKNFATFVKLVTMANKILDG